MKVSNNTDNIVLNVILLGIFFVLLPFLLSYDSIIYFLTRPTCLNCGSLVGFIQSHSLTAFMLTSLGGYTFLHKKKHGGKR